MHYHLCLNCRYNSVFWSFTSWTRYYSSNAECRRSFRSSALYRICLCSYCFWTFTSRLTCENQRKPKQVSIPRSTMGKHFVISYLVVFSVETSPNILEYFIWVRPPPAKRSCDEFLHKERCLCTYRCFPIVGGNILSSMFCWRRMFGCVKGKLFRFKYIGKITILIAFITSCSTTQSHITSKNPTI